MENAKDNVKSWDQIQQSISEMVNTLHQQLGWFTDEELHNTPRRITEFYKEMYNNHKFVFTTFPSVEDSMITLNNIEMYSLCAHHMLPFYGKVSVAYLPSVQGGMAGVSKIARAVVKVASKPQTQEYLTKEIVDELVHQLSPLFVMVKVQAEHLCMRMRGIKQQESLVVTSSLYVHESMRSELSTLKDEAMEMMK
jgi:GTP cyclohydrolase I